MATSTFWNFKNYDEAKWFRSLIVMLLTLAVLYVGIHFLRPLTDKQASGYEYAALNSKQIQQLNRIYFNADTASVRPKKTDSPAVVEKKPESALDSTELANEKKIIAQKKRFDDSCRARRGLKSERALAYLENEFNNTIDPVQIDSMRSYLCCCIDLEAVSFLSDTRIRVKSYFWLTGAMSYLEIIFWTWFGVLCSLLFNIGVVVKNSTTNPQNPSSVFDSSEIPSQVARLVYAPCCTLIIVLGYNFFSNQNLPDIGSSKGIIVFAFVGGFYTSRLISLLDRLKDVLFPNSGKSELPENKQGPLKNLLISLGLDRAIPPAIANEISIADLGAATISLSSSDHASSYLAVNMIKDSLPVFIVDFIRPGVYDLTASFTKKIGDQNIILKDEQKIEIKDKDLVIPVVLKQV